MDFNASMLSYCFSKFDKGLVIDSLITDSIGSSYTLLSRFYDKTLTLCNQQGTTLRFFPA
jgi:hypothetical protein